MSKQTKISQLPVVASLNGSEALPCEQAGTSKQVSISQIVAELGSISGVEWNDVSGKPSTFPPSSHTHPQSEVTNLVSDLAAKAAAADLSSHTGNTSNPHSVTKSQVGLGNADNTSDVNKPVSTAQQTALDAKVTGPASSNDGRIALMDGATGKLIKQASQTVANVLDRANHTGTQTLASISDAGNAASKNVGTSPGTVAAGDDSRITGAAQKASNLGDLADAASARSNLALGDSATKNTGTAAGTVAAGDDSRITGAAQKSANLSDLSSPSAARANLDLEPDVDVMAYTSERAKYAAKGTSIPSAASIDIGAATGFFIDVTGTTTITALGTATAGIVRFVRFTGALTLTHNAVSLILPGAVNITTAAGDIAIFLSLGSGNWLCAAYQIATPTAYQPADSDLTAIAALTTTAFGRGLLTLADVVSLLTTIFNSAISPTQITSNQNNYAPTDFATANIIRLSSDASRDITGLAGGAAGITKLLVNVGSQNIVLKDESGSSTAANRFALSADVTMAGDNAVLITYDATSSRWRVIGGTGGGSVSTITGEFALSGTQSVSLSANTDNWAPTNFATKTIFLTNVSAACNLTGIAGGTAGAIKTIVNTGFATVTLVNQSASSTSSNRFALPLDLDYNLIYGASITLIYDGSRWRPIDLGSPRLLAADMTFGAVLAASALGSDTHNWAPTGFSTATLISVSASSDGILLTGIAGGSTGLVKHIYNPGGNRIILKHSSSSSSLGNRFNLPGQQDHVLGEHCGITLIFASNAWRPMFGVWSPIVNKTITAGGTTGAQTIDKPSGSVNFAASATSLVVTNALVGTNSVIIATVATNDSTMKSVIAVAGSGSFTLHANAAATAETRVNWLVLN